MSQFQDTFKNWGKFLKNSSFFFCFWVMALQKIVYRQSFMLHFLSNENSNETGVFSPFLQKWQKSSIYGASRTFYILQVLDIADFLEKYFPLSSYMFSYLSKCFNRSKSRRTRKCCLGSNPRFCAKNDRFYTCRFLFKSQAWYLITR